MAVCSFLHSLCSIDSVRIFLKAVCLEIDVRGVLASYCVLMDRNSFKCVRPFRRFGTKLFSGSLSFTHLTIPGDHFN